MKKILLSALVIFLAIVSCTKDDSTGETNDNFDRKALLENIADNIIIPAYQEFNQSISAMDISVKSFVSEPTELTLERLRVDWEQAYIQWQSVSMFQIGKAEELAYSSFMNVYPANVENIKTNIANGTYDLSAISQQDEQGFAALDYLLYGVAQDDSSILALYTEGTDAEGYKKYLSDVVSRMQSMTEDVLGSWVDEYRSTFVNNSGSSATSSLDKLVNDYVYHYEKNLRAGKIGIPSGVFSSTPLHDKVEAFYKGDLSKKLFLANLEAMQNFFNGKGTTGMTGKGISDYLEFLNTIKDGEDLTALINNQFDKVRAMASGLNDNFSSQIQSDNTLMLQTYDALQKNVIFLKVDMLQALSITVDYVDADGD